MITTKGVETRVERVEWRMWVETGAVAICGLFLAIYLAVQPNRPFSYLAAGGVTALAVLLFVSGVRRRGVCIIEPTKIRYGFLKGKMWWLDRDRVGSVLVRQDLLLQVRFYGHDGKMFASHVFGHFNPKELRQAFESAGIPVR